MSDTPETDDLARGNHVVPTEWAEQLERERDEARKDLERERGRLAVCGVVAMANTEESAKRARGFDAKYQSASCDDVARIVDSEMQLRRERDEAREEVEDLKVRYQSAMIDRDSYRFQAEQKWAMRRELEELLGIDNGAPGDEQFKKGLKALKAVMKKAKLYDEKN